MNIGTLEMQMSLDTTKFTKDMQDTQRITGGAMAQMDDSMKRAAASINAMSEAETKRAGIFARTWAETKRLLDVTKTAFVENSKVVEDLNEKFQELGVPKKAFDSLDDWKEKSAYAMGAGLGMGIDKAKELWDLFISWTKKTVIIWAVAVATGIAASVLSAIYAVYKSIGFFVGLLTGESYKSANIDAVISMNKEVKTLQELLPLTAVGASALNEALKNQGLTAADYATTMNSISTAIHSNAEELDRLGVKYKDQKGNLLDNETVLQNASKVLASYTEGWDRTQASIAIGMGTEKQISDTLSVTSEKIQIAKDRLSDYGLVIGEGTQEAVAKYEVAMREFNREADLTSMGFKKAISDNIMPILTDLADFFKDGFPKAVLIFRISIATITSLFYGLKTVLYMVSESIVGSISAIGSVLGGVAWSVALAMRGDFLGAKQELVQGWVEAKSRLGLIGDNIVAQARNNASAMKLAWSTDNLWANGTPNASSPKKGIGWIPKPEKEDAVEDPYDKAFSSLGKQVARLKQMSESLAKYQEATEHARRAEVDFLTSKGEWSEFTKVQKDSLKALADEFDNVTNKNRLLSESMKMRAEGIQSEKEAAASMSGGLIVVNEFTKALDDLNAGKLKYLTTTEQQAYLNNAFSASIGKAHKEVADAWDGQAIKEKILLQVSLADLTGVEQAKVMASKLASDQRIEIMYEEAKASILAARASSGGASAEQEARFKALEDHIIKLKGMTAAAFNVDMKIAGLGDIAAQFSAMAITAGKLGNGFQGAQKALQGYSSAMSALATIEANRKITGKDDIAGRIGAYGDLADASANFFNKESGAYAALSGVAKAFHAAQMAMQLVAMGQSAVAAVLKAAATTGWPGMIAMIAAVGALGFSVRSGSNSGGNSAADVQKAQGTGTVLGDASAKSASIANSIKDLSNNSGLMLPINMSMLAALNSINTAMSGLAVIISRTVGISTGSNMGISLDQHDNGGKGKDLNRFMFGGELGGVGRDIADIGSKLWGKTKQNISDSGISIGGTYGDMNAQQYANVHTTSSSYFGLKKTSSDNLITGALDPDVSSQISKVFQSIASTVKTAAVIFGKDGAAVGKMISDTVINISKLSLQGLSGKALEDALNAAFSKAGDQLATSVLPGFEKFQQVGEGYLQTVIRVANGTEAANTALKNLGIKAIAYGDIVNTQGDIQTEIIHQSIVAGAQFANVGAIMENVSGSAADLVKTYKTLMNVQDLMNATGGAQLTQSTITGAGGDLNALQSGTQTYLTEFFSTTEQAAAKTSIMSAQFERLGITMPMTRDGFRALVAGLDQTTEAGQKEYGQLMLLAQGFADAVPATADLAANFQTTIDKFKTFSDNLKTFKDGLLLGSLSTLTPAQKYAEASAQYEKTRTAAKGGDTIAQNDLTNAMQAFLTASQTANASGSQYQKDFASVLSSIGDAQSYAQTQINLAQSSLDALKSINSGIQALVSGTTGGQIRPDGSHAGGLGYVPFNNYLANLHEGEGVLTKSENLNYRSMGRMDMAPLVNEIKSLRAEVAGLRADQNKQTGDIITTNYDANNRAAQAVADSTKESAKEAAWSDKSKAKIA